MAQTGLFIMIQTSFSRARSPWPHYKSLCSGSLSFMVSEPTDLVVVFFLVKFKLHTYRGSSAPNMWKYMFLCAVAGVCLRKQNIPRECWETVLSDGRLLCVMSSILSREQTYEEIVSKCRLRFYFGKSCFVHSKRESGIKVTSSVDDHGWFSAQCHF